MKSILLPVVVAVSISTFSAHADLVIVQDVNTKAQGVPMDMRMTMQFKGDLARVDAGDQVSTIMNTKTGETTNLMHSQKMVMKMNGGQLQSMQKALMAAMGEEPKQQEEGELKATGNKETINGFDAEEYSMEKNGETVSYWLVKDYPNKEKILKTMAKMQDSEFVKMNPGAGSTLDVTKLPGVPVKIVSPSTTVTVISMDEKEVDSSAFEIPDGYNEMQMPNMGDLLKQLPKGN